MSKIKKVITILWYGRDYRSGFPDEKIILL